ncbi:MAG: hypothetical protein HQK55_11520 [Deltaproteobacteria bacterium]|nr:hypothetical protein [Deltaproteobacteria bacterium]
MLKINKYYWKLKKFLVACTLTTYLFCGTVAAPSEEPETNETMSVKKIESLFTNQGKQIEFSNSKIYNHEIQLIRNVTKIYKSEAKSDGSRKYADIGIALIDLNGDGRKEILAYIQQFDFCSFGGSGCMFMIVKFDNDNCLKELLFVQVPDMIFILPTRHNGFFDLAFRYDNTYPTEASKIVIWRYNSKKYDACYSQEKKVDLYNRITTITISYFDVNKQSWNAILARRISRH